MMFTNLNRSVPGLGPEPNPEPELDQDPDLYQEPAPKKLRSHDTDSDYDKHSAAPTYSWKDSLDDVSSVSEDKGTSKYLFSNEELDNLLKAVRNTLNVEEVVEPKSIQDELFGGLKSKRKRVFPINQTLKDIVQEEWKNPEGRANITKEFRNRLLFDPKETETWDSPPKVDIQVSKVVKKTDLPFEDSSQLRDPMDRKADALLRRVWESSMLSLKSNIAATSVARTLFFWLGELEDHLKTDADRDLLLQTIPLLRSATGFLADASAENIRLSAKEGALSNSVRRAIWLRQWGGDVKSKTKLCNIPFTGDFMFGAELDTLLEKASDKKKGFPEIKKPQKNYSFRNSKDPKDSRGRGKQGRWSFNKGGRGRGYLFSNLPHQSKKQ
ncbi:lamina-associated polypeptide 2, isoforms alpha/zeta-like [Engystomops pustulosus]|uniref:lamina-associated polypeptide 2, isoforms alpha/zeta-like n=1 Tax=Engystomops pustulosus TaxID=76066 RepID=UPI003AFA482E